MALLLSIVPDLLVDLKQILILFDFDVTMTECIYDLDSNVDFDL